MEVRAVGSPTIRRCQVIRTIAIAGRYREVPFFKSMASKRMVSSGAN
jgi:hypothetical protein